MNEEDKKLLELADKYCEDGPAFGPWKLIGSLAKRLRELLPAEVKTVHRLAESATFDGTFDHCDDLACRQNPQR